MVDVLVKRKRRRSIHTVAQDAKGYHEALLDKPDDGFLELMQRKHKERRENWLGSLKRERSKV